MCAGYEIRVRDHLDSHWTVWFEGWTVRNLERGEVVLAHTSADQATLHGALGQVRDLNLTLISVVRLTGEGEQLAKGEGK